MVAPAHVLAMSLVALVIIAIPGPNVLFVISRGVSLGRKAALAIVVGNEAGLLIQVTAVAFGLRMIVAYSGLVCVVIALVCDATWALLAARGPQLAGPLATTAEVPRWDRRSNHDRPRRSAGTHRTSGLARFPPSCRHGDVSLQRPGWPR